MSEILSKQIKFQGHSSQDTGSQCNNNEIKSRILMTLAIRDGETDDRGVKFGAYNKQQIGWDEGEARKEA
ncbi:hypothetical protein KQX54_000340 [Cotesia glomerata]|uniref:Uncharacterized protein n=1 Tax=Cotesia glomerata TaxID=32391 RepID=A0AAV7I0P3_COTGL|nr:hypothetical protein KQX54_000340 [Cotesia glomerata]